MPWHEERSRTSEPTKSSTQIAAAFLYAFASVAVGYILLGPFPAALFSIPVFGGFFAWLVMASVPPLSALKLPFVITWALFILHKVEEREFQFFPKLAQITGTPVPDENSPWAWALYLLAAFWLLSPTLISRQVTYGNYLAWTFFLAMGVIELAHFVFPLFTGKPYAYFPEMMTAAPLAAAGLWGVLRMVRHQNTLVRR